MDLYALDEPDHCFVTAETAGYCIDCAAPYTECVGVDVTCKWAMLFLFGFIAYLLPLIGACCELMFGASLKYTWKKVANLPNSLGSLGAFCWFITACVFRFGSEGAAISGENAAVLQAEWAAAGGEGVFNVARSEMPSSAMLLLVKLALTFAAMGCACCVMLCLLTVLAAHKDTVMAMMKGGNPGAMGAAMGGGAGSAL